jgi:uncharacterized protein (TIGR00661 family)
MKFLFIVQGEGRGHLTQAISLAEILRRHGHEVVETLVGKSKSRDVPAFFRDRIGAVVHIYDAPSLVFKKNGKHVNLLKTFLFNVNIPKIRKYGKSIEMIYKHVKAAKPDAVVNFYEMLPGLTFLRYRIDIPLIGIGHQFLLKHPDYQFGKDDSQNMMILRLHTLLTGISATKILALSFYPMRKYSGEKVVVMPPLLRREVLELPLFEGDYILGYMLNSGYFNEVQKWHEKNPEVKLHFFWDKKDADDETVIDENFTLHLINDEKFLKYMSACRGYITTAGFESVCEALFMNKPMMLIPSHLEQEINAADASSINGGVVGDNFDLSILLNYMNERPRFDVEGFRHWVLSAEEMFINELIIQK